MKKFISVAVAVMMLFAVSAPAFATTSSYLPAATTLYAFDFDSLADGTSASSAVSSNYTGLTNNKGSQTKEIGADAVKGGKSLHLITSEGVWEGLSYSTTADFAVDAGEYLIFELSAKNVTDITLQVGVSPFRFMALSGGTLKAFNETQTIGTVDTTIWNHYVVQIASATATSTVTIWKNGEQVFTGTNSNGKTTNLSGVWSKSRIQLTANAGGYADDLKAWISTTAYDPSAAGDVVAITSTDFAVEDDKIVYENITTLGELYEKLSVTTGGEIVFVADDTVIEDTETPISEDIQVVARSASGAAVKVYTAKEKEPPALTSTVYTVDDDEKTITGVPYMTKVNDFKAGLTPATGKTLTVTSSNGYADAATTVTVDGTAYTVSNMDYYDHVIGTVSAGQMQTTGFGVDGQSNASALVTSTNDVLKGGNAIVTTISAANGVQHWGMKSGFENGIIGQTLVQGDVVNLEFNIKPSADMIGGVTFKNLRPLGFTADGKIKTFNEDTDTGATYTQGEWTHIVISLAYKASNGTHSLYRIYVNGKWIKNADRADGAWIHSSIDPSQQTRITLSSSTANSTIILDDVKCYKAASLDYDEAYMTGNQLVTSSDYLVDNKVVYLPEGTSIADAIYALNFPVDPVDATGEVINPEEMTMSSVFYIKENTSSSDTDASRVSKYSFATANKLTASGDKVSAAVNGDAMIIAAAYDADGVMTDVKVYNIDTENKTVDLSALEGETVKAYLWSKTLKPYSVLTKGASGTWN